MALYDSIILLDLVLFLVRGCTPNCFGGEKQVHTLFLFGVYLPSYLSRFLMSIFIF